MTQALSCEFSEFFKTTFLTEHFRGDYFCILLEEDKSFLSL